jgi:hypothetical protein
MQEGIPRGLVTRTTVAVQDARCAALHRRADPSHDRRRHGLYAMLGDIHIAEPGALDRLPGRA